MSWINLTDLWKTVVYGLLIGAGLPALFAVGLYALSRGPRTQTAGADADTSDVVYGGSIIGAIIAVIILLVILAAIGWGVHYIYVAWPPGTEEVGGHVMALPALLDKIIAWLRAGYPEGVPEHDYLPLFALLGSQLTDEEVSAIAEELASESNPDSAAAIRHAISAVTADQHPSGADVARVRARLAEGGWPLAPVRSE